MPRAGTGAPQESFSRRGAWRAASVALAVAVVASASDLRADGQPERLIALAEPIIANQMRDPESARFSSVYLVTAPTPARTPPKPPPAATVCGWVNAKNGYGGYASQPSRFYASYGWKEGALDDTQVTYRIEPGQSDAGALVAIFDAVSFEKDWRQYCLDASHPAGSGPDQSVLPTPALTLPKTATAEPMSGAPPNPPATPLRLGVVSSDLPPDVAAALHRPDLSGAWIMGVAPGSVAQKADVRVGDVVTAFDGKAIHTRDDLARAVGGTVASHSVVIRVARGSDNIELTAQF